MLSLRWTRHAAVVALISVAALLLGLLGANRAVASTPALTVAVAPGGSDQVTAKADTPGEFEWTVTCSSEVDCAGASLEITVPQPLVLSDPVQPAVPVDGREFAFDSSTRQYTVRFTEPLTGGATGLAAGAQRIVRLKVQFPPDAGVTDATELQLDLVGRASGAPEAKLKSWLVADVPPPPAPEPSAPAPEPSASTEPSPSTSPSPQASPSGSPEAPASPSASPGAASPSASANRVTAAAADAVVGITKAVSQPTIEPGKDFKYTLTGSCSSLTTPCLDFVITDVLPAEFDVTSLPQSNSQRDVAYDADPLSPTYRTLKVTYKVPVVGGTGMPAGQSQSLEIAMRLPAQTPVLNGTVITNTATVAASNADAKEAAASITANIPVKLQPVATKSWDPNTAVAKSGALSTITVGARNASTSSAQVKELAVSDTTQATFDRFDLQNVGTLLAFPAGADQVYVDVCFKAIGSPCGDGEWVTQGPQTSTGALVPPPGDLSTATGIRYRYANSGGGNLPYSADDARVQFQVKLRDDYRGSGLPIEPSTRENVNNCATPTVKDQSSAVATGTNACAPFGILPGTVSLQAAKSIYPDANGSFSNNGKIVVGEDSGVSMTITATNKAEFPVGRIDIVEPSATAVSEFDKIDATKAQIHWPTGSTTAELTVTCRSGANPPPNVPITKTAAQQAIDFGCDPGVAPASVQISFIGLSGSAPNWTPTIPPNAAGQLLIHGIAAGVTAQDVADKLGNCADASSQVVPGGSSSAVAQACGTAPVENPSPGFGSLNKTSNGVDHLAIGQEMDFDVTFKNTGNVPITNVVIVDPQDPATSAAPFDVVQLTKLTVPGAPPATVEVYDPTVGPSGAYVPYVAADTALLTRATGFRVTVTGEIPVGATYKVTMRVKARDDVLPGTVFQNTACVTLGSKTSCKTTPGVDIGTPSNNASLQKLIVPGTVTRPTPGLPPQTIRVRQVINTAANGGNMPLKQLITTDEYFDFFDAVTYAGNMKVNFPKGANRVRVDAFVNGSWVVGTATSSSTPGLPVGVVAADVKGVRVTFTNSNGGYSILPSSSIPSSSACPSANVCFDATVRATLASNGDPIPDVVVDKLEGAGESSLQQPGQTFPIPEVEATFNVVQGTSKLAFDKGPDSRIGPGDTAPMNLTGTNVGTSPIVDPIISDPLPAQLTAVPGVNGVPPYTIKYVLPTGYPEPTTVNYQEIKGDPGNPPVPGCTDVNRVCKLVWSFPGFQLPPGGKITVQFNVELTPGTAAGAVISNTAGVTGTNQGLSCQGKSLSGPPYGNGVYCVDSSQVTSVSGNNFKAEKWIKADAGLGFLDGAGQPVDIDDPQCPHFINGGDVYTRYPCTARVLPGQRIDYLIRGVNSGTNPASEVVLVDGLPVQGDNGVLLTGQQRGTQWNNRPTMLSPVTSVEGYSVQTGYSDAAYTSGGFCRASINLPPSDVCPPGSFSAPFGPDNTGFQSRLTFPDGSRLMPGQSFTLTWSMQAPATVAATSPEPIAWNSFAYRPSFVVGQSTDILPPTEPLKVGVSMPLTTFQVTKAVVGLPPGVTVKPFEMAYRCTVSTAGSGAVEVGSGAFSVAGGAVWTSPSIPEGALCRVWETNSQGGTSDNIGEANAAEVIVEQETLNNVTITNSYEAGSLTLQKTVTWDVPPIPVGQFRMEVDCGFPTLGDTLPGFPTAFDLNEGPPGQTFTGLPVGTSCQVTETDTQNATKTVITPSNGTPILGTTAVIGVDPEAQGGTTVDVQNIYQTGGILITKQLTGDGSAWAKGPFVFDVSCEGPTFHATATLLPGQLSTTVSPILAGSACTVTETDGGNAATPLPPPVDVVIPYYTIDPPGPVAATFVNQFPVNIKLTKTVSGDGAAFAQGPYTFEVVCTPVGGDPQPPVIITLNPNNLVGDITGLPTGGSCTITETDNGGATTPVVPYVVPGGPFIVPGPQDPPLEVAVDNNFPAGTVTLAKQLTGSAAAALAAVPFTIDVTCERDLTGGGTEVILQRSASLVGGASSQAYGPLPIGARCWAEEPDSLGAASVTIDHDVNNKATITNGSPNLTITAVNDFPAGGNDLGSIKLTKTLTGAASSLAQGPFVFETVCTIGNGQITLPLRQTVLTPLEPVGYLKGLPVGAQCAITETSNGSATGPVPNLVGTVTVPAASTQSVNVDPVEVTAVNDFPGGSVTVAKNLAGDAAAVMANAVFTIQLTCERDLIPPVAGVIAATPVPAAEQLFTTAYQLKGGESVKDPHVLPIGARCWIAETNSVGATSVALSNDVNNKAVVTVDSPDLAISATNTYVPGGTNGGGGVNSGIRVTKTLTGTGAPFAKGPFVFTATCTLGGFSLPLQTISLDTANLVGYFSGLPVGAVCGVAEIDNGSAPGPVPVDLGTVTVPAFAAPPVDVAATNDFPGAVLTVTKRVVGIGSGPFGFSVDCLAPGALGTLVPVDLSAAGTGGAGTAPAATFTLVADQSKQLVVPQGSSCTVRETDAKGATSVAYSLGAAGDHAVVDVTADTTETVTNTFPAANQGGGSGTSQSGLATTGGNGLYGQLLAWALLLLVGGVAAVRLARR